MKKLKVLSLVLGIMSPALSWAGPAIIKIVSPNHPLLGNPSPYSQIENITRGSSCITITPLSSTAGTMCTSTDNYKSCTGGAPSVLTVSLSNLGCEAGAKNNSFEFYVKRKDGSGILSVSGDLTDDPVPTVKFASLSLRADRQTYSVMSTERNEITGAGDTQILPGQTKLLNGNDSYIQNRSGAYTVTIGDRFYQPLPVPPSQSSLNYTAYIKLSTEGSKKKITLRTGSGQVKYFYCDNGQTNVADSCQIYVTNNNKNFFICGSAYIWNCNNFCDASCYKSIYNRDPRVVEPYPRVSTR